MEHVSNLTEAWIEERLEALCFVEWDRWYELAGDAIAVYGWIERQDDHEDFVLLEIDLSRPRIIGYHTSSEEYTEAVAEALNMEHNACKRVDSHLDVDNAITLEGASDEGNRDG